MELIELKEQIWTMNQITPQTMKNGTNLLL